MTIPTWRVSLCIAVAIFAVNCGVRGQHSPSAKSAVATTCFDLCVQQEYLLNQTRLKTCHSNVLGTVEQSDSLAKISNTLNFSFVAINHRQQTFILLIQRSEFIILLQV